MIYAYLRVSTKEQNLARQIEAVKAYRDIPDENIFSDKQSGKNLDRVEYKRLDSLLRHGDELVLKELDRLGRNKQDIKNEFKRLAERGVVVRILELPTTLIDFQGQEWVREMVNNIILEVLATMAEQERNKTLRRQREGLDAMPLKDGKRISTKTGRPIGRPEKNVHYEVLPGETISAACARLGISRTQWYRTMKERGA
ncbi:recombinase family protein [Intestinibacillus massiliensis]|nr:recombinase family protein [Intestinibacillus massiliensis]